MEKELIRLELKKVKQQMKQKQEEAERTLEEQKR